MQVQSVDELEKTDLEKNISMLHVTNNAGIPNCNNNGVGICKQVECGNNVNHVDNQIYMNFDRNKFQNRRSSASFGDEKGKQELNEENVEDNSSSSKKNQISLEKIILSTKMPSQNNIMSIPSVKSELTDKYKTNIIDCIKQISQESEPQSRETPFNEASYDIKLLTPRDTFKPNQIRRCDSQQGITDEVDIPNVSGQSIRKMSPTNKIKAEVQTVQWKDVSRQTIQQAEDEQNQQNTLSSEQNINDEISNQESGFHMLKSIARCQSNKLFERIPEIGEEEESQTSYNSMEGYWKMQSLTAVSLRDVNENNNHYQSQQNIPIDQANHIQGIGHSEVNTGSVKSETNQIFHCHPTPNVIEKIPEALEDDSPRVDRKFQNKNNQNIKIKNNIYLNLKASNSNGNMRSSNDPSSQTDMITESKVEEERTETDLTVKSGIQTQTRNRREFRNLGTDSMDNSDMFLKSYQRPQEQSVVDSSMSSVLPSNPSDQTSTPLFFTPQINQPRKSMFSDQRNLIGLDIHMKASDRQDTSFSQAFAEQRISALNPEMFSNYMSKMSNRIGKNNHNYKHISPMQKMQKMQVQKLEMQENQMQTIQSKAEQTQERERMNKQQINTENEDTFLEQNQLQNTPQQMKSSYASPTFQYNGNISFTPKIFINSSKDLDNECKIHKNNQGEDENKHDLMSNQKEGSIGMQTNSCLNAKNDKVEYIIRDVKYDNKRGSSLNQKFNSQKKNDMKEDICCYLPIKFMGFSAFEKKALKDLVEKRKETKERKILIDLNANILETPEEQKVNIGSLQKQSAEKNEGLREVIIPLQNSRSKSFEKRHISPLVIQNTPKISRDINSPSRKNMDQKKYQNLLIKQRLEDQIFSHCNLFASPRVILNRRSSTELISAAVKAVKKPENIKIKKISCLKKPNVF